ncbi:MAG: IS4 family transposase [Sandaracinaceae bacterium]|nr:IS4 family transposase [Sandaracinaceae bacterium]
MEKLPAASLQGLVEEMSVAALGDGRRTRRLVNIVERMAQEPDASFPEISRDLSELEALYRFVNNPKVTPEAIIEPHLARSRLRASSSKTDVIVAHDTTYFSFEGEREGLGRINKKTSGFWAHMALAVSIQRDVYGAVGLEYGTRHGPSKWSGSRRLKGVADDDPSESLRWPRLVTKVAERFGQQRVIHVLDREADWFELLQHLVELNQRFVVRMTHDRRVEGTDLRVSTVLAEARVLAEREVHLSERANGGSARARARHPGRKARLARLEISAESAEIVSSTTPGSVRLNFVRVVEVDTPEGCEPVLWTLMTSEPIATRQDVLRVVDAYRARWVIEEYFKALKTGCAFEKRQLGSYRALLNALAFTAPVASLLLRLRTTGREDGDKPAEHVLDRDLLDVLLLIARRPMPEAPTARDVMYAVAGLGGHLPRNGPPGWITLSRGFTRLREAARVLALRARSDQS